MSATANEEQKRLATLKQDYGVKEVDQPREVLQDMRLDPGQKLGSFVVSSWEFTPDAGVQYRLAQKRQNAVAAKATVRVYQSHRDALDDTLLKYGGGYTERPKRGHHHDKGDIGDFSLFTTRTLTFVRRNVRVDVVAADAGTQELVELARAISGEIDRRALLWGKNDMDAPSVKVAFERGPQTNGGYEVVVALSVSNGVDHAWKVFSSEGQVETGDKRAVVRIGQGKNSPDIRAVVTTRSGYVFEQRSSD
jgi:hypothetical protein